MHDCVSLVTESTVHIADCFRNNPSGKGGCAGGINEKGEHEYCYGGGRNVFVLVSASREGHLHFMVVELWY